MLQPTTLLIALLLAPAEAEKAAPARDVLWLGKVELALDTPEEKAKAELEKHYVLKPAAHTRSFFVMEKAEGQEGRSLGAVEFEQGRLTSITRERRGKDVATAAGFAKTLADALGALVSEGRTSCTLAAEGASAPVQVATILCGRKQVSIAIVSTGGETKAVVTEMLR